MKFKLTGKHKDIEEVCYQCALKPNWINESTAIVTVESEPERRDLLEECSENEVTVTGLS